jgi:hypothetical protein
LQLPKRCGFYIQYYADDNFGSQLQIEEKIHILRINLGVNVL